MIQMVNPRALCSFAVTALMLLSVSLTVPSPSSSHPALLASLPTMADAAALPVMLLPRVNARLGADDPAYAIAATPDGSTTFHAVNPAHHLRTTFAPDGVTFTGDDEREGSVRLSAVGTDAGPAVVVPVLADGRVEYRRGNVTEWYLNSLLGKRYYCRCREAGACSMDISR